MKILVIIPAYNEEKSIIQTVKSLKKCKLKFDYIVINDGSSDDTLNICQKNDIRVVNLPNNLGIGGAMQTGYLYARENKYDVAIQFDGDGQHNADYIEKLIEKINEGNNMVIGSRFIGDESEFKSTKIRRLGINLLSLLIKMCTNKKITDPTSGFRAIDKSLIEEFSHEYPVDYPEPDTIVSVIKKGFSVCEVPVKMNERKNGKSSINALKAIYYMIKVSLSIIISAINTKKVK